MTLVSVHLPKTAGTSLCETLKQYFGSDLALDYDAPPMQAQRWGREWHAIRSGLCIRRCTNAGAKVVHGHFLPVKYWFALAGKHARYVTWLRDPVERVISHYHYWWRDYAGDDPRQPLRNRMLHEDWSLERFCLGPEMRNLYSQYLWGFPVKRFDFIGITERYEQDLARFAHRFMWGTASIVHTLANPSKTGWSYDVDPVFRKRIERHHAADMRLYRWALARTWT